MIDYIEGHYLNVSKCNPLEGKSYIPLPKELQHHSKGLINSSLIQLCAVVCLAVPLCITVWAGLLRRVLVQG